MTGDPSRRALRTLAIFAAAVLALLTFWRLQPGVDVAQARLNDARTRLRSDALIFAARPRFAAERRRLLPLYGPVASGARESTLLRTFSAAALHHGVEFVAGNVTMAPAPASVGTRALARPEFDELRLAVELRGSYRSLLLAIDEVARTSDLVRIDGASLHESNGSIDAAIALTLLRPREGNS